jgi:hypothetical protein
VRVVTILSFVQNLERERMREMPEFRSPALRSVFNFVFCGRLVRSENERNGPNAALCSVSHSDLFRNVALALFLILFFVED